MNDSNSPVPAPKPSGSRRPEATGASTQPPTNEPRGSQLWWFAVTVAGAAMLFVLFSRDDGTTVSPSAPSRSTTPPAAPASSASRPFEAEPSPTPAAPSLSSTAPTPPPPIITNPPRSSNPAASRTQNLAADPDAGPPAPPAPAIPATREQARQVVDGVQFTLRDYRTALGGNPVGTNVEITQSLLGDNQKQAKFTVPDGSLVNGHGELCDPWGTPYFFHALARDHMEVRSAGPDRKMYTPDDIVQ